MKSLREQVLEYARYTCNKHSSEFDDIDKLNEIFGTDIKISEIEIRL